MQSLPVSFFENLKTQKNAKIEKDEVIPFRFSIEVLEGERKVKVERECKINCVSQGRAT